jgi:hypothetical protein
MIITVRVFQKLKFNEVVKNYFLFFELLVINYFLSYLKAQTTCNYRIIHYRIMRYLQLPTHLLNMGQSGRNQRLGGIYL